MLMLHCGKVVSDVIMIHFPSLLQSRGSLSVIHLTQISRLFEQKTESSGTKGLKSKLHQFT